MRPVIIANGGAGGISFAQRRYRGLCRAVKRGYEILKAGGSSVDAVCEAVCILEDTKIFNAGTGSAYSLIGEVEMDASVMTSERKFGAVGAIKNVKNPIKVARLVMERTDHLLLCGDGAVSFARKMGIKFYNPKTKEKRRTWRQRRKRLKSRYFKKLKNISELYGTVGVVAIDKSGLITVGTSTGGITLHLPGRMGDTPILGGGTYADKNGAVSATGHGEEIMRNLLAYRTVCLMAHHPAPMAGKIITDESTKQGCRCGMIGIDKKGRVLCIHNTPAMSWCYIKNGQLKSFSGN